MFELNDIQSQLYKPKATASSMDNLKQFLGESQDSKTVEKTIKKLNELLVTNEHIAYISVQKKPITISADAIALTDKRIIICRPQYLGLSMSFQDFPWREVSDCHIKEGVIGSKFEILTVQKTRFFVDYLPKSQARILYRYAQEQKEKMMEYRRQLSLENTRAAAGGVVVQHSEQNDITTATEFNPSRRLKILKELLDQRLISQEEYDKKKAEILKTL